MSNILLVVYLFFAVTTTFMWWDELKRHFTIYDRISHKLHSSVPLKILVAGIFLLLTTVIAYRGFKYYKTKKDDFSIELHAWIVVILRYWLAYENSVYGYAKIFKRFFSHFFDVEDTPAGDLSGIGLTWFFFGYSHEMSTVIALSQIVGGTLLFFRRTTVLGALILLTVVVNIIFINIYYMSLPLAMFNSVLIALGLVYLLMLQWDDIKLIFFSMYQKAPTLKKPMFNWTIRGILAFFAFFTVYFLMAEREFIPMSGKWQVDKFVRNGVTLEENEWLTDSNHWKNIYIEAGYRAVFSPNPYIYDKKRAKYADFKLDPGGKKMRLVFINHKIATDTAFVDVQNTGNKKMIWSTIFRKDTLQLMLTKLEKSKTY
ncbi:MAG: hypothetical protein ABIN95_08525 [Mucilaginibacter sp.]